MTAQSIADRLKQDMLTGALPPGTRLKQTDVADRFAVSRIPARDALALLAAQGLVSLSPNRGALVQRLDIAALAELFDLRVMLETDCLRRAIPAMTPQDHARIDLARRRSDLEATGPHWAEGDRMFHATLYAPAQRPHQTALIDRLRLTCQVHIACYQTLPKATPKWLRDHRELADHAQRGDAETAVTVLDRHLRDAQAALRAAMAD